MRPWRCKLSYFAALEKECETWHFKLSGSKGTLLQLAAYNVYGNGKWKMKSEHYEEKERIGHKWLKNVNLSKQTTEGSLIFFFSLQFPLYVLLNHLSCFTVHYRQKKPTAEKSTLHTGRFIRFLLHVDTPSNGADLGDIYRLQLNGVHILSPPLRHRRRWRGRSLRWQRRCRESGTDNDELFNPTLSSLASCPMCTFVIFSFFAPL